MCNRKKEEEREKRKDKRISTVSYKVHPNPPTCKLYLYLGMGNIWRVVCMDCSIFFFFSLSFLYVLYRSILSIYLLIPLERERQDNMKQSLRSLSSYFENQTPVLILHFPYEFLSLLPYLPRPPLHSTSTPPNPFLLPPLYPSFPFFLSSLSFISFPFLSFPSLFLPFPLPFFNLLYIYIYIYQSLESLESDKSDKSYF